MNLNDDLGNMLGSPKPAPAAFTLGEVAALFGVVAVIPHEIVEAAANGMGGEQGVHLLLDYSSALIKLGDALKVALDGKRYQSFARQVADIEQIRARMNDEEAA